MAAYIIKIMAPMWLLLWSLAHGALAADFHKVPLPPSETSSGAYRPDNDPTVAAPFTDARADRIIRDSCQRCHDNARVALVRSGQRVLPAIRRSANFNLEPMNFIENRSQRLRILRAIETGGMPFADEFVIDRERIARHTFLESATGRDLKAWLRAPAP